MQEDIVFFLEYLQFQKNYSAHTLRSYRSDLLEFCQYLTRGGKDAHLHLRQIDHISIRDFLGHLHQKGNAKTSIARKLAAIRSFFRYMYSEGKVPSNPARLVRSPRQPERTPRFLTIREVETILELPDSGTVRGIRDRAILELLYASGLRVGELVRINLEDLSLEQQITKVYGKGKKERLVPFGKKAEQALRRYVEKRGGFASSPKIRSGTECAFFESLRLTDLRSIG